MSFFQDRVCLEENDDLKDYTSGDLFNKMIYVEFFS